MRILWVHNFPPTTVSSGIFMFVLLDALRAEGLDITLHQTGNLRGPLNLLSAARTVRKISRDYDIAHAQFGSACGYVTSWAQCPRMVSLRGTDLLGMNTGGWKWLLHGRLCRLFNRMSFPHYQQFIVMSNRMRRELVERYRPRGDIQTIPDGIDLRHFVPMDRDEARRALCEGDNRRPWVLFSSLLGKSNPTKRAELAWAAYEVAKREIPDLEIRLMTGVTHDRVPYWVNASDVLLLTSTREGWPNIVKEALSCNVPFVSTDVSDVAEVAAAEPNCRVCEPTPEALGAGIVHAIRSGRTSTLRRHVADMDVQSIARRVRSLYERMMSAGAGQGPASSISG